MSIEADIFQALDSLVGNRVFPDVAPFGTQTPYITYQQVGGSAANFLEAAVVGKRNARMQINCWATTRLAAADLARSVEDAMVTTLKATVLGAMQAFPPEDLSPMLYGTHQDFGVWY